MPSSHRSPHIPDWDTAARAHGGRASLLPVSRLGELRQLIPVSYTHLDVYKRQAADPT